MRKIIIIIFLLFSGTQIFSQNTMHNLKKYWYYRDRLEEDFMIVGQPEKQGTNFPASDRHYCQPRIIAFGGDNPVKGLFSPWLCVLATEYRLLKDYGQNEKTGETLQRIAWALYSFDRLDMNTEKFFRARENGVADNDPEFWDKVDNYIESTDLNGFFRRGDTDGFNLENFPDDIEFYNKRTYPLNPNENILTYNNGQLIYDDLIYNSPDEDYWQNHMTSVENGITRRVLANDNYTIMSDDEILGLLIGLVFIKKYVNSSQKFTDILGRQVTIEQWVDNITGRVFNYVCNMSINNGYPWYYGNPVCTSHNGFDCLIKPGSIIHNSFGYSIVLYRYFNLYYAPLETLLEFHEMLYYAFYYGYKQKKKNYVVNNNFMFSAMTNIVIPQFQNKPLKFFQKIYMKGCDYFDITVYENLPLLYGEFNNKKIKDEWDDKLSGFDEYTVYDYKDDLEYVLNLAPDCGPYKMVYDERSYNNLFPEIIPNEYWFSDRFWQGGGKFIKRDLEFSMEDNKVGEYYVRSFYNGLDYMLLHNLYWLQFKTPPVENIVLEQDFPFEEITYHWDYQIGDYVADTTIIGSKENPETIIGEYITANNTIFSDGDVTYIAAEEVLLNTGFEAKPGANFEAYINPNISKIYKYHYYKPTCYFWDFYYKDMKSAKADTSYSKNDVEEDEDYSVDFDVVITEINVSPNPFSDVITISSGSFNDEDSYVNIYDIYGTVVFQTSFNFFKEINLSHLSSGIYFVKTKINNKIITKKIIKQ